MFYANTHQSKESEILIKICDVKLFSYLCGV